MRDGIVAKAVTEKSLGQEVRIRKNVSAHGQDLDIDIEARVEAEAEKKRKELKNREDTAGVEVGLPVLLCLGEETLRWMHKKP